MARIFAFVTFLCLTTIIVMGLASPNDPFFLLAAQGPIALACRAILAILMLGLAFGYELKLPKLRSYLGAVGFGLIAISVIVLAATEGSGAYPYIMPADLWTAVIVGITCSIVSLETTPATSPLLPGRYFFYQDIEEPAHNKRLKATSRQRTA